jgi:hypothetical protein
MYVCMCACMNVCTFLWTRIGANVGNIAENAFGIHVPHIFNLQYIHSHVWSYTERSLNWSPINNPPAFLLRRLRQERCAMLRLRKDVRWMLGVTVRCAIRGLRKDVRWMLGVTVLEDSSCSASARCVVCQPAQSSCRWQSSLLLTEWADDCSGLEVK